MKFNELGLSEKVLKAVEASGYDTPTPIQEQAIPHARQGRDVLGIAQTGTGKTAAFTLPMLSMLERGRARARMPRTLILEPTRELAAQVEEAFAKYGVNHKLNLALLIGGVSFGDQETKIARGADVVIATPGRLLDFTGRGGLLLNAIEILVIDEADRMLDMGFIPDIERICKLVPFTRQTLFFSATMPPEITRLADAFLHNPVRVEVSRAATTAENIVQALVPSGGTPEEKRSTLRRIIRGAENIAPAEIEDVLLRHPAVLDAVVVVGVDDPLLAVIGPGMRSGRAQQHVVRGGKREQPPAGIALLLLRGGQRLATARADLVGDRDPLRSRRGSASRAGCPA